MMKLKYLLFPELGALPTNEELKVYQKRIQRMVKYFRAHDHNRLRRQGTDTTQEQKKKGLLPPITYCARCKVWCEEKTLRYYHVDEAFKHAVIPVCPKCLQQLDQARRRRAIDKQAGQIMLKPLFQHEIEKNERLYRLLQSVARNVGRKQFPHKHTEKKVKND